MANSQPSRRPCCLTSLHASSPIFTSTQLSSAQRIASPPQPFRHPDLVGLVTLTRLRASQRRHPSHNTTFSNIQPTTSIPTNCTLATPSTPTSKLRRLTASPHHHTNTDLTLPMTQPHLPQLKHFEKIIALLGRHHSLAHLLLLLSIVFL